MSAAAVIAVVGPTASGKTALALALAQRFGGEIVNADAFSCYVGMDIGTAKVSPADRETVRHHLIDTWEVEHDISVAEYQQVARAAVDDIHRRGRPAIVVGGSGLYVRALLEPLEFPGTDSTIRAKYNAELEHLGAPALHAKLAEADPAAAAAILPTNGRRIVRALEVIELTGRPFTATLPANSSVYPDVRIGIDVPRPVLDSHIDRRVEQMFAAGFVAEVEALAPRLRQARTAARAVGYGEVLAYLDAQITLDDAKAQTAQATRRLARRQLTWFKRDSRVVWLDSTAPDLVGRAASLVAPRLAL